MQMQNPVARAWLLLDEAVSRANTREQTHDRAGDASRHAQNIGTSLPQVQSTPLSRTSHLDAGQPLRDGGKVRPSPCK